MTIIIDKKCWCMCMCLNAYVIDIKKVLSLYRCCIVCVGLMYIYIYVCVFMCVYVSVPF